MFLFHLFMPFTTFSQKKYPILGITKFQRKSAYEK